MLPPQLMGRRNIPTDDYSKLFTNKTLSSVNTQRAGKPT